MQLSRRFRNLSRLQQQYHAIYDVIDCRAFETSLTSNGVNVHNILSPCKSNFIIYFSIPTRVPTAAINFKHEVVYQPDWILRDKFTNLARSTTHEFGGHFAAMHTPKVLVDDVFESVKEFLKYYQ